MNEEMYLTAEGAARLKAELAELKGPQREAMAKRLREAISQGDLSENADYHKAKEDQSFMEGRIQELEYLLKNAIVVENGQSDTIQVGVRFTIQEEDFPPETFTLVGAKEADPRNGRISNESPIGSAMLGKRAGDIAEAETPGGKVRFKVIEVG